MSFVEKIFNNMKGRSKSLNSLSNIKFGRFAEPTETDELYELRTTAEDLYKAGNCLDAYVVFFNYLLLLGGPAVLLSVSEDSSELDFKLLQGSKVVCGTIGDKEVTAESVVAEFTGLNVALMRFLLNRNCQFAYSKFAVKGNSIVIRQRCPIKDLSPQAFSDMLSEIAITADSCDQLLENEFEEIVPVDYENIIPLKSRELKAKIEFLRSWIAECFSLLEEIESESQKSYIVLSCVFKILYLISPEGILLNQFRDILDIYMEYSPEEDNFSEVNYKMQEALKKIAAYSDLEIEKSLYKTYCVFPELEYRTFNETAESFSTLLQLPVKCIELRKDSLVIPMCEYIVGYHLYRQGMAAPAMELLLIFWKTLNPEYFTALGFKEVYYDEASKEPFDTKGIMLAIDKINKKYAETYPLFEFNISHVDFSSPTDFAYTFLFEFKNLQITD
ncbi:MAG: hypothetical protein II937_06905 [Bacteroidales bacterium]|nr:hypothetical protein [Bacteroidales bacterium]